MVRSHSNSRSSASRYVPSYHCRAAKWAGCLHQVGIIASYLHRTSRNVSHHRHSHTITLDHTPCLLRGVFTYPHLARHSRPSIPLDAPRRLPATPPSTGMHGSLGSISPAPPGHSSVQKHRTEIMYSHHRSSASRLHPSQYYDTSTLNIQGGPVCLHNYTFEWLVDSASIQRRLV